MAHKTRLPSSLGYIISYGVGFASIRMLVGAVSAVYLIGQGVSVAELGWLKSYQFLLILCLDIPISYLADNVSRKLSVILAGFCSALSLLLTGWSDTLTGFYVAETFNALSLLLFNGAFVAYLIDSNNRLDLMDTKALLGLANKYDSLLMALASFVGAVFITTDNTLIWYGSAVLMLVWVVLFIPLLPKDVAEAKTHELPLLTQAKMELGAVLSVIKQELRAVFVALCVIAVYMQLLIQLWQPIIYVQITSYVQLQALSAGATGVFWAEMAERGYVYATALSVIFLVQSLAGHWVGRYGNYTYAMVIVAVLLTILPVPMFYVPMLMPTGWAGFIVAMAGLCVLFLLARFASLVLNGVFHDRLPKALGSLRASMEALYSVATKLILMAVFPIASYLLQGFGVLALMALLAVLGGISCWCCGDNAINVGDTVD